MTINYDILYKSNRIINKSSDNNYMFAGSANSNSPAINLDWLISDSRFPLFKPARELSRNFVNLHILCHIETFRLFEWYAPQGAMTSHSMKGALVTRPTHRISGRR